MYRRLALALVAAAALVAVLLPGAALAKDRNHDRIPDRWERAHHLSLHHNQARRDQDRDGLRNRAEFRHHTNPRRADTDRDGLDDGTEVEVGDNPRRDDSDRDGIEDGDENAGTVASFDGTTLRIDLADGDSVAATVNGTTEIKCDGDDRDDDAAATMSSHGGDDPAGDDHGDDDRGATCGAGHLQPGTIVHEAELRTAGGQAVWHEVELRPAA